MIMNYHHFPAIVQRAIHEWHASLGWPNGIDLEILQLKPLEWKEAIESAALMTPPILYAMMPYIIGNDNG